ncbi:MAG: DNA repair protein RadC [Odoribacteraceae bacterium]|nr:DNA repair protein RadC [Odoribacteraceae bacterium]
MKQYVPISSWAEDDKPREKMVTKGVFALSTNELLAILLRSGCGGESALDVARRMLSDCNNDLNIMARWGVRDFTNRYKGVGVAKAASVIAAFELARRRDASSGDTSPSLTSSQAIYDFLRPRLGDLEREEFWILLLNNACRLKSCERLFSGGIDSTTVDLRVLFARALEEKVHLLVIAHNHPSGNLRPSEQDISLTRRIREGAKTLDMNLLDHLIVCAGGYYSFADEGIL